MGLGNQSDSALSSINPMILSSAGKSAWQSVRVESAVGACRSVLGALGGRLAHHDESSARPVHPLYSRRDPRPLVNLDFDARVPIPFSVFPSSYRSDAVSSATQVRVEGAANLPSRSSAGREGHEVRYSSFSAELPRRHHHDRSQYQQHDQDFVLERERQLRTHIPGSRQQEDFYVEREDTRYPRDRFAEVELSRERYQEPYRPFSETHIDVDAAGPQPYGRNIDNTQEYYDREYSTVDAPRSYRETEVRSTVPRPTAQFAESSIDIAEREYRQRSQPLYAEDYPGQGYQPVGDIRVQSETTVDAPKPHRHRKFTMGYYDEDGQYHSFRHGLHRAADRILHPLHPRVEREDIYVHNDAPAPVRESVRMVERGGAPNTITIPCHHIRIGDLLILQGRPCQVIRITTSAQTGQHRYLGVDLFTKQLHEESSFVSNPSPSVIVQNMLGPVFKQYRVLDIRDDGRVVAMTETGDVKQGLPVLDQGGLWSRLNDSFANGRGSVRVLVINDAGRELAVDYKVVHGSRL
ncbi:hypothetical protein L228DRAFT_268438 [Xylona heveae TC161]|uniref:Uncharacterized protein n=1 Tax=Xylona heveae (strain CBS 132557 / TC161) TaxID=1328760 RepID=A0A165H7B9_XYLHT|nr:hypothetical protein L228DRAFT_268438 [Xylona heveae TC161]KZF23083.1 hypothetical protein L228DRAFT_268438 [Xylona heveae TC161]